MCGIAGIVHANLREPVNAELIEQMTRKLQHRGPDDFGVWVEGGVGLGHQRLSIIDLTGGHQPMAVNDEAFWVTYNGEIYNFRELRVELEAKGYQFQH